KFATIKNEVVNLRDQPTTEGSKIIDKANAGDKLFLIREEENNWLQIRNAYNDTAFVHGNLATVTNEVVRSEIIRRFDDSPNMRYTMFLLALIPLLFWNIFLYRQDKRRKSIFITYE